MLIALSLAAAVIMLLAALLMLALHRNSEMQDLVDSMKERPSLDGLSDYSKRLVTDYTNSRRLHDGLRYQATQRAKTKPYAGQWE